MDVHGAVLNALYAMPIQIYRSLNPGEKFVDGRCDTIFQSELRPSAAKTLCITHIPYGAPFRRA